MDVHGIGVAAGFHHSTGSRTYIFDTLLTTRGGFWNGTAALALGVDDIVEIEMEGKSCRLGEIPMRSICRCSCKALRLAWSVQRGREDLL